MNKNKPYTRLLKRQLKKTIGEDLSHLEKLKLFLDLVNDAYIFNIEERELYQRAEEISARDYAKLNQKLVEKNNFLDTFNHGLAHDIKNHSSNIIGLVNMLKKYTQKGDLDKIKQITTKLDESSNQLTSIVQGFLHISREETHLFDEMKIINAQQLINAIENEINFLKQTKPVQINYKINEVFYLESTLKIILVNLVSNSIKYSKPKQPAIIDVEVNSDNNHVFLKVTDNGIGMDLSKGNKKIYNLFNDSNATKGYGVGLFLVKKITDKRKGKIEIKSTLNKGTEIKIIFPKNIKK